MDIQPAVTQRAGVGRFTRCLAQNLGAALAGNSLRLVYFDFLRRGEPFPAAEADFHAIRCCPGLVAAQLWKRFKWPPFDVFAGPADIYHFPNFLAPPVRAGKVAVHIYDTSFLQFPQFTEERNLRFLKARIRDTAARADAVFTVSRTSAGEIHRLLNVPTDRIFCVYPGIDAAFRRPPEHDIAAFRRKNGLDRPYLLTVGTIEPRKNLEFLVDVFDRLNRFDGDLVLAGGLGWKYEPILERISKSPRAARIRRFGHIPDGDLPALYAGAELFVLPSLYEGFGLPPVEAMACGVPVVASSGGALPEILGASARIVGSFSVDDWTQAIDSLLADTSARGKLSEGGPRHASGFSWSATAAQTAEVYRKVLR